MANLRSGIPRRHIAVSSYSWVNFNEASPNLGYAAAGFQIRAEPFVNELPPEQIRRFGLRPDLDPYVYVAVKS